MSPNTDDTERRQIRDAMDRLLKEEPIRSDGKLTIKSLAAEAGLLRWYLTHKHTDLKDEFYDKVRVQDAPPAAMAALHEQIAALKEAQKRDRAALRDAVARTEVHARETQVLALENDKLRQQISGTDAEKPRRRTPARPGGIASVHDLAGRRSPPDT